MARLKWKGSIEAQRQHAEAAGRLKPKRQKVKNRRKQQTRRQRREQALVNADYAERRIREEAEMELMTLLVTRPQCSKHTVIRHWIFRRDDGSDVAHYWPSNGKVWAPDTGERWTAADADEALALARARREV